MGLAIGVGVAAVVAALCVAPSIRSIQLGVLGLCPDGDAAVLADLTVDRPAADFLVRGVSPVRQSLVRTLGRVASIVDGELDALPLPDWMRMVVGEDASGSS